MAENFDQTAAALFKGMEEFITTKTVVGEPVNVGDATLIPLVDVSFGMMASNKAETSKRNGGGGMGGKISPSAVLILQNGSTRLVSLKNQDGVSKVIDMMPDIVNHFTAGKGDKNKKDDLKQAAKETGKDQEQTF